MSQTSAAWLIRAGSRGEDEDFNLSNGVARIGFQKVDDLTSAKSQDDVRDIIRRAYSDAPVAKVANFTGQLWRLRCRVEPGDLVVLPRKKRSEIALGVVTHGYEYRDFGDGNKRHCVTVDWRRTDVQRSAIGKDLLASLGAFRTVSEITRNNGAWRLSKILDTGLDPAKHAKPDAEGAAMTGHDEGDILDLPEPDGDLEQMGRDQIREFMEEKFTRHDLAYLVAAVLNAEGFLTEVSGPGADGGIDVFAGRGPFGLDSPKLVVQVKSGRSQVDVKVVRELRGVLSTHQADQALLVAWGGVTKAAQKELRGEFFRMQLWRADDMVNAVLRNYERLDEEWRASLPLKRIWSLASEPAE